MRKRISRILFTGGVAALVVGLAATASLAITLVTWNVAPGGTITLAGGKATFRGLGDDLGAALPVVVRGRLTESGP